ncbi:hypothetical protein B0H21DRAFT_893941 [Amylocystis lapponica]|nr:hypothetical protein B0H21DRAFT_893941 [Amylocystis lapponica]
MPTSTRALHTTTSSQADSHEIQVSPPTVGDGLSPDNEFNTVRLLTAISDAKEQKREGPWYGAWQYVCLFFWSLVQVRSQKTTIITVFPQYPLEAGTDNDVDERVKQLLRPIEGSSEEDGEVSDDPIDLIGRPSSKLKSPSSTAPPPRPASHPPIDQLSDDPIDLIGRSSPKPKPPSSTASSPHPVSPHPTDSYESDEFESMPRQTEPLRAELSAAILRKALEDIKKTVARSTRIPDFVLKTSTLESNPKPGVSRINISRKVVVLLVEIKKEFGTSQTVRNAVRRFKRGQAKEQAWHTFSQDKELERVGSVIGVGDLWHYYEYTRAHVKDLDSQFSQHAAVGRSSSTGDTQAAGKPIPFANSSKAYRRLRKIFGENDTVPILGDSGRAALQLVAVRLMELTPDLWQDDTDLD